MENATQVQSDARPARPVDTRRYAKCVQVSRRIRWEIERDVIRGRTFDFARSFLPEGLARTASAGFLSADERRLISQIQGRTYTNMFGLVERFIGAKILEVSRDHWLGDQVALEALVRFSDEELKHQELFRRIERMVADGMPQGYRFDAQPNEVARAVLAAPTWSVLALTCMIELFTQQHYHASIAPDAAIDELYRDVFLFHWREESQHAILDELEWRREDGRLTAAERDRAVDGFTALAAAVDGILQLQARADADCFFACCGRPLAAGEQAAVRRIFLGAYRWQYILSGAQDERFSAILAELTTPEQRARVGAALAPIIEYVQAH